MRTVLVSLLRIGLSYVLSDWSLWSLRCTVHELLGDSRRKLGTRPRKRTQRWDTADAVNTSPHLTLRVDANDRSEFYHDPQTRVGPYPTSRGCQPADQA